METKQENVKIPEELSALIREVYVPLKKQREVMVEKHKDDINKAMAGIQRTLRVTYNQDIQLFYEEEGIHMCLFPSRDHPLGKWSLIIGKDGPFIRDSMWQINVDEAYLKTYVQDEELKLVAGLTEETIYDRIKEIIKERKN